MVVRKKITPHFFFISKAAGVPKCSNFYFLASHASETYLSASSWDNKLLGSERKANFISKGVAVPAIRRGRFQARLVGFWLFDLVWFAFAAFLYFLALIDYFFFSVLS